MKKLLFILVLFVGCDTVEPETEPCEDQGQVVEYWINGELYQEYIKSVDC